MNKTHLNRLFFENSIRRITRILLLALASATLVLAPAVMRLSAAEDVGNRPAADVHPLDEALAIARRNLKFVNSDVHDYTGIIIKRERMNGKLPERQFVEAKVRHERIQNNRVVRPLSVYLKFLKPDSVKGREVIWVKGRNQGKLIAHDTGFKNLFKYKLDPNGAIAMYGQRYPITKIGFQNMLIELIARGERDKRRVAKSSVKIYRNAKVDDRPCTLIEILNPKKTPDAQFYRARIFIDDGYNVPVRYAAWAWPSRPGGDPILEEEYTYVKLKLNVGLTDKDFDPDNRAYNYP